MKLRSEEEAEEKNVGQLELRRLYYVQLSYTRYNCFLFSFLFIVVVFELNLY